MAERAGVNPQTLRYYERRGLLTPPGRSPSGYREYPVEALARLRFIKRAQALGFSLDEAEDLLHLAAGGPAACDAARELAGVRLADSLAELVSRCDLPRADRACTLLETLNEPTGELL